MAFKKNDKVKYKAGRADSFTKGVFLRKLNPGAVVPNDKKLVSTKKGDACKRESALVELKDGSRRLIGTGYLKAA